MQSEEPKVKHKWSCLWTKCAKYRGYSGFAKVQIPYANAGHASNLTIGAATIINNDTPMMVAPSHDVLSPRRSLI